MRHKAETYILKYSINTGVKNALQKEKNTHYLYSY